MPSAPDKARERRDFAKMLRICRQYGHSRTIHERTVPKLNAENGTTSFVGLFELHMPEIDMVFEFDESGASTGRSWPIRRRVS